MLTGCAQDLIFSDINRDTVEVLSRNGCEVITPPEQLCCGSLHAHNGEWELAQQLARKQIDQFPPEQFDAIISNAGGCGSHLKHYRKLLADDPVYRDQAVLWDEKVKDIHEWLMQIGIQSPANNAPAQTVTYHESCHLAHGQKITAQPRQLLQAIPNLKLVESPRAPGVAEAPASTTSCSRRWPTSYWSANSTASNRLVLISWPMEIRAACCSSSMALSCKG